jgi:hypothetical protein
VLSGRWCRLHSLSGGSEEEHVYSKETEVFWCSVVVYCLYALYVVLDLTVLNRILGCVCVNPEPWLHYVTLPQRSSNHYHAASFHTTSHANPSSIFCCGKKYCKYKKGLGSPIRPSVVHSHIHLILLQRSPRKS